LISNGQIMEYQRGSDMAAAMKRTQKYR